MIYGDPEINAKLLVLRDLFETHMRIKAPTFEQAFKRAGHKLPRALRAQATQWVDAEQMAGHPKLARRLDRDGLETAFRAIKAHLITLDMAEQRRTRLLNLLAGLAFKGLIVAAVVIAVTRWRGLI